MEIVNAKLKEEFKQGGMATGIICYKKISAQMKRKMYKMLVRPAMFYGLES